MQINKDTKLFGSFSSNPGNNGCKFFNSEFKRNGIDAIYKSFIGLDAEDVFNAAKILGFSGYALSMPLKIDIINFLDNLDIHAREIGAVNTVVLENGIYKGYNTDWLGVRRYLVENKVKGLSIVGNGGFSRAIQYCCKKENIDFDIYTRANLDELSNAPYITFNATPADVVCDIDGRPSSATGKLIAKYQALEQYKLYVRD